jgi:hypothetical protein
MAGPPGTATSPGGHFERPYALNFLAYPASLLVLLFFIAVTVLACPHFASYLVLDVSAATKCGQADNDNT